jgi:phosphatidate cytidylyltransferase
MDKQRVVTGAIFFAILLAFLIASIWLPLAMVIYFVIVAVIGSLELGHALRNKFTPLSYVSIVIGSLTMLTPCLVWYAYRTLGRWHILKKADLPYGPEASTNFIWLLGFGSLVFLLCFVLYAMINIGLKIVRKGPDHLPHAVAECSTAFTVALPLSAVVLFQFAIPHGYFWLLYALVTPMIVDVSAYYAGSYFGKKKMLPEVSPNKTWMGFIAGLAGSVVFSLIYFLIFFRGGFPLMSAKQIVPYSLLTGLIIGLGAQVGDWVFSSIKRWCGIKDFSKLLPGHGGIMDRFDSVFYSLPLTMLMAFFFYLLKR